MASDHNSPRSRRHTVESGLRKASKHNSTRSRVPDSQSKLKKKKDITDPDFKTKEQKLKDKKAKLKNKDGVRSKILDVRLKKNKKKTEKAMEKAKKYAQVEVTPLKKKEDRLKNKEVKAYKKYKKAKESGDGDKTSKKYDKLVKRQVKSIKNDVKVNYDEIKKTGPIKKRPKKGDENYVSPKEIREAKKRAEENESYVPSTGSTKTVVVNAKDNKRKKNKRIKDDYSVSVNEEGKSDNPAQSRHIKVALKKGSVHYKTGPIQYKHSSNLRMDDMVSTVGPLQGSDGESTVTQVSPMGKKANIVHKMASKRNMLKKMDAMHNGEPGVQKEDFEQFKNK
jgi:hypothetical protein